jgi:alkylhydroperoxidase family enzyme
VQLRAAGLGDQEILDATHVIAMFAWANRLLETLGEVVYQPQPA